MTRFFDRLETPGRPMFHVYSVGARDELKTRGGSLSSEGANAAAQAERPTPIKLFLSRSYISKAGDFESRKAVVNSVHVHLSALLW